MGTPPLTPIEQLTRRVEEAETQVRILAIQVEQMAGVIRDAYLAMKKANHTA